MRIYLALCAGFSLGYLSFFFLPLLTPILVANYGVQESLVGWVVGAEVAALTLSTVLLSRNIASANWFSLSLRGVLVLILSNLAMLPADGFVPTLLLRALSGVGEGALLVCAFAAAGATAKPEKSFGLMSVVGGLLSAAGLILVPGLLENWGDRGLFVIFALAGLLVIPLLTGLNTSQSTVEQDTQGQSALPLSFAYVGALSGGVFLLALSGYGIWPFLDFQAVNLGLAEERRASLYAFTTLMNVLGSVIPVALGMRLGLKLPVIVGSLLCVVCLISIGLAQSQLLFMQGSSLLLGSVAMVLPYVMAFCAMCDESGQLVARMPAVLGMGQASGPVLAGILLPSGFATVGLVFGLLCLLSTLLFALVLFRPSLGRLTGEPAR